MNNKTGLIFLLIFSIFTVSCMKSQLEVTYNKQEEQIDKYISQKDTLAIVRNSGANRIIIKQGEGEGLAKDGYVSFYYAGYAFNGSVSASNLFTTNRIATAQEANWNIEDIDVELYEISLKDAELIPGLKYGLKGVKPGEECEILFSAKYGFGNKALGIIPAKTALLYKIWVVGVTND